MNVPFSSLDLATKIRVVVTYIDMIIEQFGQILPFILTVVCIGVIVYVIHRLTKERA